MYKCSECGQEFETKPDYCDCGNNEFISTDSDENKIFQKESEQESVINLVEPATYTNEPKQVYYSERQNSSFKNPFHPIALTIFIICLICSLLIIFVWNPVINTTENNTTNSNSQNKGNTVIPPIEKLWKEADIITNDTVIQEPIKPIEQVKKVTIPQLPKIASSTKSTIQKIKPIQQTPKTVNNVATSKTTTQTKTTTKVQENIQQQKEQEAKIIQQKANEAKLKAEAEALAAAEKARKTALAKQELANYKINLRNELGKKIDFTKVIGDGDCIVSFKLDSTGKLINRAFAKQSSNITLNNAVYNAVMATPSYSPPPSLYNNETYRLNIKFSAGNFAITLE